MTEEEPKPPTRLTVDPRLLKAETFVGLEAAKTTEKGEKK